MFSFRSTFCKKNIKTILAIYKYMSRKIKKEMIIVMFTVSIIVILVVLYKVFTG